MSQNVLPIEDLLEESPAPAQTALDPQDLHARLLSAFSPAVESYVSPQVVASRNEAPTMSAIDAARTLAAATLRQGEDFENFQERVVRLEHGPDVGVIRQTVQDLSDALLQITAQTQKASTEAEARLESLADVMAVLSGHMATHRQEVQTNIATTGRLSLQLQQLQQEIAGQRAEAAQLNELIASNGQSLRNELQDVIAGQHAEAVQLKELIASTSQSLRNELQNDLAGQRAEAAQLKDLIQSSGQSLRNELQNDIAGQRAEAGQLKALISSTGQSLRNDLDILKGQVSPLDGRLNAEGQRIAAIEARIAALPELESSLAAMASQADGLDSCITSLTGRTGVLETCSLSFTARAEKMETIAAALTVRMNDLDYLKGTVHQLAADDAKLAERCALMADDLDTAKGQVIGLEDAAAALADSSIRSSEGLSTLGNALEAAKTQIFSLNETSQYLTERLRIAEQVVESFTRREKILAELHSRAAQALQVGQ